MAVNETVTNNSVRMQLNIGVDAQTGVIRTSNVSLGTLSTNPSDYNSQKAMNIVNALAPCLTKAVYRVQRLATSTLEDSV